jgi:hypothetical protein
MKKLQRTIKLLFALSTRYGKKKAWEAGLIFRTNLLLPSFKFANCSANFVFQELFFNGFHIPSYSYHFLSILCLLMILVPGSKHFQTDIICRLNVLLTVHRNTSSIIGPTSHPT